jgi:hypothetical protein
MGIPIVTDKWLISSHKAKRLLSPAGFTPQDRNFEKTWRCSLEDVRGTPQDKLFSGKIIYFTPTMRENHESFVQDIKDIVNLAGAHRVARTIPMRFDKHVIVIAADGDYDPDAEALHKAGMTCYTRDLLTTSILRGLLDLGSGEFVIAQPTTTHHAPALKKRGRPRKS